MTEIERIIAKKLEKYADDTIVGTTDEYNPFDKEVTDYLASMLAKVIEQEILKARIEELEWTKEAGITFVNIRIAELNKSLTQEE